MGKTKEEEEAKEAAALSGPVASKALRANAAPSTAHDASSRVAHEGTPARVNERDRHLCALLSEGRWMTTGQLRRLMTPGRHESALYRRLRKLSTPATRSGWLPLLRQDTWVTRAGVERVWSVTDIGAVEANRLTRATAEVRRNTFEPLTMEHHAGLTEVFVQLLEAPLAAALARARSAGRRQSLTAVFARALHPAWRWKVMGNDVSLPWKEYQEGAGLRDKVIRPDAVLELLAQRRRLFIEYETGSHSVQPISRDKDGGTVPKLRRYEAYLHGFADVQARRTWYASHFADGFAAEVVFVVATEGRAQTVGKAIAAHRPAGAPSRLKARAVTVEQLVAELRPLAHTPDGGAEAVTGKAAAAPTALPQPMLSAADVRALTVFFSTLRSDLKHRQALAKAQRGAAPVVPEMYEAVKALVSRLGASSADSYA